MSRCLLVVNILLQICSPGRSYMASCLRQIIEKKSLRVFMPFMLSANDNDAVNSLTLDQGLEVHFFLMNHFIISVVSHSVDFCVESSDFAADGSRHLQ